MGQKKGKVSSSNHNAKSNSANNSAAASNTSSKKIKILFFVFVALLAAVTGVLYQNKKAVMKMIKKISRATAAPPPPLRPEESPCLSRPNTRRGDLNDTQVKNDGFCDCPTAHPDHNDEPDTNACAIAFVPIATGAIVKAPTIVVPIDTTQKDEGDDDEEAEVVVLPGFASSVVDGVFQCRQDPPPLLDSSSLPSSSSQGGLFSFLGNINNNNAGGGSAAASLKNKAISSSLVDDGICDCCDCSDEPLDSDVRKTFDQQQSDGSGGEKESGSTTIIKSRQCRTLWKQSKQLLANQLAMVKKGHAVYQKHVKNAAQVGSEKLASQGPGGGWRGKLMGELQSTWETFSKKQKKFNRKIERIQLGEIDPPSTEKEMMKLQREEAAIGALNTKMASIQGMIESGALGVDGEYFTLWDDLREPAAVAAPSDAASADEVASSSPPKRKCLSTIRHEKEFRGGSPDPEEYETYFEVCLFHNVTQRRATIQETLEKWGLLLGGEKKKEVDQKRQLPIEVQLDLEKWENEKEKALAEDQATLNVKKKGGGYSILGYWNHLQHGISNLSYAGRSRYYHHHQATKAVPLVVASGVSAAAALSSGAQPPSRGNVSVYAGGDQCWEGPPREVRIVLVCHHQEAAGPGAQGEGEETILSLHEDGKCIYEVTVGTPRACNAQVLELAESTLAAWSAIHSLNGGGNVGAEGGGAEKAQGG